MASANAQLAAHDSRAHTPSSRSRGRPLARHARRLRLYARAALLVVLAALVIVLVAANSRSVKLDWALGSTHTSLVWVITAATALGWLLGVTTAVTVRHRTRRTG